MTCKPVVLSSGEWALPVSFWHRREGENAAMVVSSDQGATWAERGAHADAQPGDDVLNRIAGLVDEGRLGPDVGKNLPLRETQRAHELIQTGHTRGKIVLRIKDG